MPNKQRCPSPRTRIVVRDVIVIVVGVALSLCLLKSDLGVDDLDHAGKVWGRSHQLLREPGSRWRGGLPLVLWYPLAGLAISGPFVASVRPKPSGWSLFSGRSLWFCIGALTWLQIALSYGPIYLIKTIRSFDFQWKDHYPSLLTFTEVVTERVLPYLDLFTFFAIPLMTLVVVSVSLWRGRERTTLLDGLGFSLGVLWVFRNGLLVYSIITNMGAFTDLP